MEFKFLGESTLKFEQIKIMKEEDFRRLTGIKRKTFEKMMEVLSKEQQKKKSQGGKPNKLALEEQLLMTLEYLREYRTYFHISRSYGMSESACYRNIRWVEDTLIKSKVFSLPGRKALLKSEVEYEVVLVDASETPIQRPQKNSATFILEKRKGTR